MRTSISAALVLYVTAVCAAADPWADVVVAYSAQLNGSGLYNDPAAVLGPPATTYYDPFEAVQFTTSMAGAPFNLDAPGGHKIITTIPSTQFVIVAFDGPVQDDPRNPYGLDLLVFGNAFFGSTGGVTPTANMANVHITDGFVTDEPVLVAVSSSGLGTPSTQPAEWYVYTAGPWADGFFPTQAYSWNHGTGAWGQALDFTRPVDPALEPADFAGLSVADAISYYGGSGGGTGFDLAESGFSSIRYVYLSSALAGESGEIDALADVFASLGDADRSGRVDLADFAGVQRCFSMGRGSVGLSDVCRFADFDGDLDVDASDYAAFAGFLTGP
jgi:hypothetical protein